MHMLDTNMCIYVLRGRASALRHRFETTPDLCMSVVTYAELCFGIENGDVKRRGARIDQLALFVRRLSVLPLTETVGPAYGSIRTDLRQRGELIGHNDLFIAAHAISENAVLVTNKTSEFKRVPGLRVENWVQ